MDTDGLTTAIPIMAGATLIMDTDGLTIVGDIHPITGDIPTTEEAIGPDITTVTGMAIMMAIMVEVIILPMAAVTTATMVGLLPIAPEDAAQAVPIFPVAGGVQVTELLALHAELPKR